VRGDVRGEFGDFVVGLVDADELLALVDRVQRDVVDGEGVGGALGTGWWAE